MSPEEPRILEKRYAVTEQEAIQFMGGEVPHVLSTPSLVNWMELTCREALMPLLAPGEDSVGVSVQVKHLAATPVGMKVKVISRLTRVEGRVFTFEIEAYDDLERIGEATHQRASVLVSKFAGRVAAKKEKAGGGSRT
ncbi:MAG TPA: thioesterase family protein [Terriglobia bacterium]|nr:thioesterase family protein [Terriglobia bacterium]